MRRIVPSVVVGIALIACLGCAGRQLSKGVELRLRLVKEGLAPAANLDEAVHETAEILRRRLERVGLREFWVGLVGENEIRVQVPNTGSRELERAKEIVTRRGKLAFMVEAADDALVGYKYPEAPLKHRWLPFAEKEKAGEAATHMLVEDAELVTGANIAQAYHGYDEFGKSEIHLEFDNEGKRKFAEVTEKNVNRRLAIVLDGVVQSAPRIDEPIPSGQARIRGKFDAEEAKDLSVMLDSGELPASLELLEERSFDTTEGKEE
ncbi:MAG: hypothetical protein RDV41_15915 [Planctomycetota bacterium]|nr:hypothetical protein [Planctomycetota bacterium]